MDDWTISGNRLSAARWFVEGSRLRLSVPDAPPVAVVVRDQQYVLLVPRGGLPAGQVVTFDVIVDAEGNLTAVDPRPTPTARPPADVAVFPDPLPMPTARWFADGSRLRLLVFGAPLMPIDVMVQDQQYVLLAPWGGFPAGQVVTFDVIVDAEGNLTAVDPRPVAPPRRP